ncbi:hypothetical protein [Streptosporangium minutum]|uniref:hypothetical protein n=1 Tax=Streptosporangium minutum TaxID=569862 RepID=UPI0013FDD5B8|nr:hypothetical protein [Streptosporangium minutum]
MRAVALFESSAGDDAMSGADRVMVHDRHQEITRDVRYQVTEPRRGEGSPEPKLLSSR